MSFDGSLLDNLCAEMHILEQLCRYAETHATDLHANSRKRQEIRALALFLLYGHYENDQCDCHRKRQVVIGLGCKSAWLHCKENRWSIPSHYKEFAFPSIFSSDDSDELYAVRALWRQCDTVNLTKFQAYTAFFCYPFEE